MSRMTTLDPPARIKRGSPPRKRVTQKRLPPPSRRKQAQALALIPPRWKAAARTLAGWLLVLALIGAVIAGLVAMRLPQMIGMELGALLGDAGFTVKRVEIGGLGRVQRSAVEDAAMDGERAMALVDLDAVRARVLTIGRTTDAAGWVADARVSRRWPDTLVVAIEERRPAAVWQYQRQLMLVDATGLPIERVRLAGPPLGDLPTVIGEGANRRIAELDALLASAPALKPVFDGATWRGNRRWDLRFKSGETLMLPEGDARARAALAQFVALDATSRLLGRGYPLFDMRNASARTPLVFTRPAKAKPGAPAAAPASPSAASIAPPPALPKPRVPVPADGTRTT